ncbi:MAG: hypothetical protein Q8R28_14535 [Dehalococcoidia bacterium]|nr:hypothetical protein [Dehalococcoidia bacterium]
MKHRTRADGRKKAQVTVGRTPDGKPIDRYVYARTEAQLKEKVGSLRLEVLEGGVPAAGKLTVAGLLDVWLDKHVSKRKPGTQAYYRIMVAKINAVLGGVKVRDLSPLHIEALLSQQSSEATARASSTV